MTAAAAAPQEKQATKAGATWYVKAERATPHRRAAPPLY